MTRVNDLLFVRSVVADLEAAGITTWLFGGWAKELLGMSLPREHHDVDLLYPADDFGVVDEFFATRAVDEILAKHFPHKRAFELDGIMVELFLVRRTEAGFFSTEFWGTKRYEWPANLLDIRAGGFRVASAMALLGFDDSHADLGPSINGKPVSAEEWLRISARDAGPPT